MNRRTNIAIAALASLALAGCGASTTTTTSSNPTPAAQQVQRHAQRLIWAQKVMDDNVATSTALEHFDFANTESMAKVYAAAAHTRLDVKQLMPLISVSERTNLAQYDQSLALLQRGVTDSQNGDYVAASTHIEQATAMLQNSDMQWIANG